MPLNRSIIPWLPFLLWGCSAFRDSHKNAAQVQENQRQNEQSIRDMHGALRPRTVIHEHPWVSKKPLKLSKERLPAGINYEVTFATGSPMEINEFSKLINKLCGFPVRVTPDAEAKLNGVLFKESDGRGRDNSRKAKDDPRLTGIRWQGKLDGLLDVVSSSLGLSWKYDAGEIHLHYLDSRTFHIYAIPSETEMKSVVKSGISASISGTSEGGESSGSSDEGQSSQTTSVMLKSAMVRDIRNNISSMLTPSIGRLSESSATGTITVTDTPEVLNRIQFYVDQENRSITKQVLLIVKILAVSLDDKSQFNIDWSAVFKNDSVSTFWGQGRKAIEKATGNGDKDSKSGDGSGSDKEDNLVELAQGGGVDGGSTGAVGIIGKNNSFKNSRMFLDALAKQGKVSVVTSPSVTTLNLQPVPVQIATQTTYVKKREINTTSGSNNVSNAVIPGTVTHGFNMNLLPFVMEGDQLLLQYSINLSQLIDMKPFGEKKDQIELPEVANRIFSQKVKLKSGQTLVLSGFEQVDTTANRTGTNTASNWLFGGGALAKNTRSTIVIMITPVVME